MKPFLCKIRIINAIWVIINLANYVLNFSLILRSLCKTTPYTTDKTMYKNYVSRIPSTSWLILIDLFSVKYNKAYF